MADPRHLLLIDSSGFCYRAYFAYPKTFDRKGRETHAVIGFMSMVWKMLGRVGEADPPTYGAAVFDAPGKTFRHKAFKDYKAGRSRPEGLEYQLPIIREAAHVLGLEPLEHKGFEADDVLATLATMAKTAGMRTTLVSVDKDMLQLVEDNVIEVVDPVKKVRVLTADVLVKFGVRPEQVPHVQALCGDSVDNIPGVMSIGDKTATKLIAQFGTIEQLIVALLQKPHLIGNPQRHYLLKEQKNLPLYLKLATLRRDVPLEVEWATLVPRPATRDHIKGMLKLLHAEDMLDRLFPEPGRARVMYRRVDPIDPKDAFVWWDKELWRPGQRVPDVPQCGFYKRTLVKLGAPVPVKIWREADVDQETGIRSSMERLYCDVNGERADANSAWGYCCAHPITEKAYHAMKPLKRTEALKPSDPMKWPLKG